ncbi:hypothetical protein IFM89_036311 [Coptis chinensis]|uniref:Uncharacterized protein n=1 Tax=Coptis chinensis TaxID=261450 RepID=A0A835IED0_9MAGN|nr:hypothetical protein IFM89_036311 [Coptis chinensis]
MSSSSSSLRLSQLHSRKVLREKEQIKFEKKLWIVTEEIIFLLLKRWTEIFIQHSELSHAYLYTTSPHLFSGDAEKAFDRVRSKVKVPLYRCDCYAYALLASGFVNLAVESGLKIDECIEVFFSDNRMKGVMLYLSVLAWWSALDTILKQRSLTDSQRLRGARQYTSRVHVADICEALRASFRKPSSG